jgi:hypothetical protein
MMMKFASPRQSASVNGRRKRVSRDLFDAINIPISDGKLVLVQSSECLI